MISPNIGTVTLISGHSGAPVWTAIVLVGSSPELLVTVSFEIRIFSVVWTGAVIVNVDPEIVVVIIGGVQVVITGYGGSMIVHG